MQLGAQIDRGQVGASQILDLLPQFLAGEFFGINGGQHECTQITADREGIGLKGTFQLAVSVINMLNTIPQQPGAAIPVSLGGEQNPAEAIGGRVGINI